MLIDTTPVQGPLSQFQPIEFQQVRRTAEEPRLCIARPRHVAYWESVKVVDRIEEEGERADTTVVREKERFSQRLTLLYADGRIELLSERPAPTKNGDTRDEERTSANGQADLCAPDAGHGDERLDSSASACG
jgi:hypothetical protein